MPSIANHTVHDGLGKKSRHQCKSHTFVFHTFILLHPTNFMLNMSSAQHAFPKTTFPAHFSLIESKFTCTLIGFQLVSSDLDTLELT